MERSKFFSFVKDGDLRVDPSGPAGESVFPIFELDENGDVVDTGRKKNIQAEIESFKDSVLLSKIIERCQLTGESLEAPIGAFGDARVLPQNLMELKERQNRVSDFVDSLSDADLASLNELGFDAFLSAKLSALKKETPQEGGEKGE